MPSELFKKQIVFLPNIAELIRYATQRGCRLTEAEGYVKDTVDYIRKRHPGIVDIKSPHREDGGHFNRLAKDMNLFLPKNGQNEYVTPDEIEYDWIVIDHPMWQKLGAYWKSLHLLNRWGGDFLNSRGEKVNDFNHFSMEHGGVQ